MSIGPEREAVGAQGGSQETPNLGWPGGLEVSAFSAGSDEYVIFSYPLPSFRLPGGLTPAERAVIECLLRGDHPDDIALNRKRSISTIRNQIRAVYKKLGVSSRAELAVLCGSAAQGRE